MNKQLKYYYNNLDKMREKQREYYIKNKDKLNAKARKRLKDTYIRNKNEQMGKP